MMPRHSDAGDRDHKPSPQMIAATREAHRIQAEAVEAAIKQLESTARVPEGDRPSMAEALARLGEEWLGADQSQWMIALFIEAFDQEWESQYKKRKRYLRFSDEVGSENGAGAFNAHGRNFVRLAHAIADQSARVDAPKEDVRRKAELRLIAGTSFDSQSGRHVRKREAMHEAFAQDMQRLANKALGAVDLDRYRELANTYQVGASAGWPEGVFYDVSSANWGGEGPRLDLQPISFGNLPTDIVPRVMLGHCWVRQTGQIPFAEVEVSLKRIEQLGEKEAIRQAMAIGCGFTVPTEDTVQAEDAEHDYLDDMRMIPEGIIERLGGTSENDMYIASDRETYSVWLKYSVHLEFRFDDVQNRWKICISQYTTESMRDDDEFSIVRERSKCFSNYHSIYMNSYFPYRRIISSNLSDNARYVVSYRYGELLQSRQKWGPGSYGDIYDLLPPLNGLQLGVEPFPTDAALDYTLTPISADGARWSPCIAVPNGPVVGAQRDSIAHAILANLAHAQHEQRLDRLLIADARTKLKAMEAFHAEQTSAFDEKLRWLREPD